MTSNPYSLSLRAEIKKGRKMERIIEVSIPMSAITEAVRYRQPFCDAICAALKKAHRRDKRAQGKSEKP